MANEGKAYIHAALALYYAGKEINEENLKNIIEALGMQADEPRIKMIVAGVSELNLEEVLSQAIAVPAAAPAPTAPATEESRAEEEKKEEEKKEEEEAEVDISEGLGGLFGGF